MDISTSLGRLPVHDRPAVGERPARPALTTPAGMATAAIPPSALGRLLLTAAITAGSVAASSGPWCYAGQGREAGERRRGAPARRADDREAPPGHCGDRAGPGGEGAQVRVLGPVEVAGSSPRVRLAGRAKELVVLLAVTGGHWASRERIRARLGADADTPMSATYLRQTCTRARALLGAAADGRPLLAYEQGGYRLHPGLVIDWEVFEALVARAKDRGPDGAGDLRRALSLVRGEPLEDCGYRWIDPVLVEHMRCCIVEAADLLARLGGADAAMVAWAACRGLLADPYAEPLYRKLMIASHLLGHSRGVHVAYQLCAQALGLLDLRPHPQTVALYRYLTDRRHHGQRTHGEHDQHGGRGGQGRQGGRS